MSTSERLSRWGFRLALSAVLLAAGFYLVLGGEYTAFDLRELRGEHEGAQTRLDSLRAVTDSLNAFADSLTTDPAVIERVAREEHGMVRDNEQVYFFVPADSTATSAPPAAP